MAAGLKCGMNASVNKHDRIIWLGLSVAETVMVATRRCVGLLIVKQGVTVGNGAFGAHVNSAAADVTLH